MNDCPVCGREIKAHTMAQLDECANVKDERDAEIDATIERLLRRLHGEDSLAA